MCVLIESGEQVFLLVDRQEHVPEHMRTVFCSCSGLPCLLQSRRGGPTAFTFHKDQQQGEQEKAYKRTICILLARSTDEVLKIAFFF